MPKHNNIIPNVHLHKDWKNRVKTWFNQPGRKQTRRRQRNEKAAAIFPRPLQKLRPVVHCPTIRYNSKVRLGRGARLSRAMAAVASAPAFSEFSHVGHDFPHMDQSTQSSGQRQTTTTNLREMFPDIESDVLTAVLEFHNGDVEATVAMLLSEATSASDAADFEVARQAQNEIDEQHARSLHQALQEELKAEAANEPGARVAAAVAGSAKRASALLQRALARPLSARKSSSHSTRLLDATAEPSDALAPMGPIESPLSLGPLYVPPTPMAPPPPSAPTEASETAPSTPLGSTSSVGGSSPPGTATSSDLYSSRVGRA